MLTYMYNFYFIYIKNVNFYLILLCLECAIKRTYMAIKQILYLAYFS